MFRYCNQGLPAGHVEADSQPTHRHVWAGLDERCPASTRVGGDLRQCYKSLMNLAQIREAHKDKWVLIEYRTLDRDLEVIDGDVIAEASTKEEIYKLQMTAGAGKSLAIRYCGEWPTDVAVMFWLRASR